MNTCGVPKCFRELGKLFVHHECFDSTQPRAFDGETVTHLDLLTRVFIVDRRWVSNFFDGTPN
ncbi:MAG TPA: hypothetical protein VG937_27980 [Polyangiaceae bacterium]|nr:hypothetical protein [Polyangiaceae bacterium]